MNVIKYILTIIIATLFIVGCNTTPNDVLPKEEMAQLLADIHIGESIVDVERTKYYSDSLKKTVKQSILIKHHVTQDQLDTSFAWYGRNIEEYIAVYDRVIEILDEDIMRLGSSIGDKTMVSLEGDSVDAWQGYRSYSFNNKMASQYISFSLPKDHNWEKGDYYIWRMKLINNISPLKWSLIADYSDGSSDYIASSLSNEGWNEISLISDSTKTLNRIYGYIHVDTKENEIIYIDSISLSRMRLNQDIYKKHSIQHKFEFGKNKKNNTNKSNHENIVDDEKVSMSPLKERSFLRRKTH